MTDWDKLAKAVREDLDSYKVGDRIELTASREVGNTIGAPIGSTGTISTIELGPDVQDVYIAVRMDEHMPVLDEWENECIWVVEDFEYYPPDRPIITRIFRKI